MKFTLRQLVVYSSLMALATTACARRPVPKAAKGETPQASASPSVPSSKEGEPAASTPPAELPQDPEKAQVIPQDPMVLLAAEEDPTTPHSATTAPKTVAPPSAAPAAVAGQAPASAQAPASGIALSEIKLGEGESLISVLGTNDLHGAIEEQTAKDGSKVGGMATIAGIAQAIRAGLKQQYADRAGALLVDSGDQFQGTLLSNYNEGELMFSAMNEAGYDAVVPGNHDYDFGPLGWEVDQDPKGGVNRDSLLKLAKQAKFSLLSANTYLKSSLRDQDAEYIEVDGSGCKPKSENAVIVWTHADRPDFLKPWLIKEVAGVRVALIGIDNSSTPTMTTAANVSDLCFRDEVAAYLDARQELEGKADVFVVLLHGGNAKADFDATDFVEKVLAKHPGGVHAVMAGHTHFVNDLRVKGVPIVQSGSGSSGFSRVDLVWDAKTRKVARVRWIGGATASLTKCNVKPALPYCAADKDAVVYEGVAVKPNATILSQVKAERERIKPLAEKKMGNASAEITVHRTDESPLSNLLADSLRTVSVADIAFLNTGGIRAPLPAGAVSYEAFYRVLPFNNHGVIVSPMKSETLRKLLQRSIQTCGSYGALMQSGLRVTYERDCAGRAVDEGSGKVDSQARLVKVETLDGQVLIEDGKIVNGAKAEFKVATLDFLAVGGAGYGDFVGTPQTADFGIAREAISAKFERDQPAFNPSVDGRWKNVFQAQP